MTYYYVLRSSVYDIKSTDSIDDLILWLYTGAADFISETQRSELKLKSGYLDKLRGQISSNENRVPLYDIRFNDIYLISAENVYMRIFHENYRFIDKHFYSDLVELADPTESDIQNKRFLSYYSFDVLQQTYLKIFYDSFVINSYITSCRRPSFNARMDHIKPYYDIDELYYLGLDWDLIKPTEIKKIDSRSLCKEISTHDIQAQTLLAHQIYIADNKAIGLVKNYSLFGSYFINRYLRMYGCCISQINLKNENLIKNSILENQIKLMIKLIQNAPAFTKSHTVYRFVESDQYIRHLNPSDTYVDPSFMSTTRNPFTYQENYTFGYILIKIKISAGIPGLGLCIESYSNFPSEEEIIFPPTSVYELVKVTDNPESYHHIADKKLSLNKVKKKYEFVLKTNSFVNGSKIKIDMLPADTEPDILNVNLETLFTDENIAYTSIADRLKYFAKYYVNENSQFQSNIGKLNIKFILESYDSSTVYKPFFYYETPTGLLMYSFHPVYGNINIMLELGPDIHLNYYFRYSISDTRLDLNHPDWIRWLSLLAWVVGSRKLVIHSNYISGYNKSDTAEEKQIKTRYTYSETVYTYLKNQTKLFEGIPEITPDFDYVQLDLLRQIPLSAILKETDRDELYRVGKKSGLEFMSDFYIYVMETIPSSMKTLEEKLNLFYETRGTGVNPLNSISYSLNAWAYLYNKNLIKSMPSEKEFRIKKGSFKKLIGDKKIPQFKNRLRYYLMNK